MKKEKRKSSPIVDKLLSIASHIMKLEKGTFLFQQGETIDDLYVLLSGKVSIGKISADGHELAFRMCHKGDIIGELALYSLHVKYLLNAKVIESGEVAIIKKEMIEDLLKKNNSFAIDLIQYLHVNSRRDQTKFRDLILYGKRGALYSTLIRLTNSYGVKQQHGILIDFHLTNQELANFCGTSRESVNRLLSELKRDGIISMVQKKIVVHQLDYLRKEIDCDNCPAELCSIN